jgi:hypothetical protein
MQCGMVRWIAKGEAMRRMTVVVSALLLLSLAQIAHAKDPFEGTTWTVTVTPDDDARGNGARPFDDTLIFKGGKFTSETLKAKGFDPIDFDSDTRRGPLAAFTANTKSDKDGTAKWTGTTTGSQISGDLVWTKADGTVLNYSFTGDKKN